MDPSRKTISWRVILVFPALAILVMLSMSSGVWATPMQIAMRQTVPTRTPGKPVNAPTGVSASNTRLAALAAHPTVTGNTGQGSGTRSTILLIAGVVVVVGCGAYIALRRSTSGEREPSTEDHEG